MVWWVGLLPLTILAGEPAGLTNGSFETDTDNDGAADGWVASGDATVTQRLRRERGADGGWCQVLACTSFAGSGPASHAMLAQNGTLRLREGQWYRFSARLRAPSLPAGSLSIALRNTANWSDCGLSTAAFVGPEWAVFQEDFRARQTTTDQVRLQMWWTSVGEVWFDDVQIVAVDAPKRLNTERIAPTEARNLLPNGGFEAGPAGWGSLAEVPGWGGNFNRLRGTVVDQGAHRGSRCLRVAVTPDTVETIWFDYYDLVQVPALKPLAANRGWLPVEPGRKYVLSAWLRAEPALTAVLRVRHGSGAREERAFPIATGWARVELPFTARADQAYVALGPDLTSRQPEWGTLWLDDVMVEAAERAGEYAPRGDVELGVEPLAAGGLFAPGVAPGVRATVANHGAAPVTVPLTWRATDFRDQPLGPWQQAVEVPAGGAVTVSLTIPNAARGFYRLTVESPGLTVSPPRPLRLAVIPANRRDDTICGMNHGYPTGELLDLSRQIGLGWFRDWSLKWQTVEPTQGQFDFSGPDAQIDRVRRHDLRVLAVLPFPSAIWASSHAADAEGKTSAGIRNAIAAAPRDPALLAAYVRRTVEHYRGRIDAFEIFNEPIYTGYSLPQALGYTAADYARLVAVASQAVKVANPQALVIAGIQCLPNDLTEEFCRAGGLATIDAVSIHSYPGRARPETLIGPLANLRRWCAEAGRPDLPIYWTEGAYYADDDPPWEPYSGDWLTHLPSERMGAEFTVRLNAILCGHHTRRIIYHSGTPGEINRESLSGIYFEYDGLPRKMTPALATFNELLGPDFVAHGPVATPADTWAFRFDSDGRTVIVAWSAVPRAVTLDRGAWQVLDLVGNPVAAGPVTLSTAPVYLLGARPGLPAPPLD